MEASDPRATLESLCRTRGEDFAGLSKLLGRNPAYVQQFVRRGVPRKLDEGDRATLARYFGIDESLLGGPPRPAAAPDPLCTVPRLAVRASAGPGALADAESPAGGVAFERRYLRSLGSGDPAALSLIRVTGDSMAPTLADGDEIMVDRNDAAARLRDGIYVLRHDDALLVKRLGIDPVGGRIAVRSDNPAYVDWPDCDPADITPVGRVVWVGRRLA